MGLLGSPAMLFAFLLILLFLGLKVQSSGASFDEARALDSLLQNYAYRAFVQPVTGIAYDGRPPSSLSGIAISVLRLRSGSLRDRGVSSYKEFVIPTGVIVQPYGERLALVYQNLGNYWSTVYYPLSGYDYLTPVVGLLCYDAFDLSATNLPELNLSASDEPICITFSQVKSVVGNSTARCATFDLQGTVKFSNVSYGNVCSTVEQGHFAIVIKSPAPSPSVPVLEIAYILLGVFIGGLVWCLLVILIVYLRRSRNRARVHPVEEL